VTLAFRVAETAGPGLVARLNEAASGQLEWLGQQHE
jgi:hypothetical protein